MKPAAKVQMKVKAKHDRGSANDVNDQAVVYQNQAVLLKK